MDKRPVWHSVEEQLPGIDEQVIVLDCNGNPFLAHLEWEKEHCQYYRWIYWASGGEVLSYVEWWSYPPRRKNRWAGVVERVFV